MQFSNLLIISSAVLSLTLPGVAFVPHQQVKDLQGSFDVAIQRAVESANITPKKSSAVVTEPKTTSKDNKAASKSEMASTIPAHTVKHKKWGVDNQNEEEYWYDSRIHTLGNQGIMGALHAALAPISTKMIDNIAYEGVDIRAMVAEELRTKYCKEKAKIIDLCCGVGFSTRALTYAFPDAEKVVGVDTSPQMLAMARFISAHVCHLGPMVENVFKNQGKKIKAGARNILSTSFLRGNAESTPFENGSFDVVTIMYAFHEAPKKGRQRILEEARRLLSPGGVLAVIDISSEYQPSESMLAGEPYVIEYQKNIHKQLGTQRGFYQPQYKNLVPGHVGMWLLRKSMA